MLYDLWNQKTIWDVSSEFHVPRGFIQSLLTASAAFASALSHFCQVCNPAKYKNLNTCVLLDLVSPKYRTLENQNS